MASVHHLPLGLPLLADSKHSEGEVAGHDVGPALREGGRGGTGAGGEVEDLLAGLRVDGVHHHRPPDAGLAEGKQIVHEVVAGGHPVEHRGHVSGSLVELCAHPVIGHRSSLARFSNVRIPA